MFSCISDELIDIRKSRMDAMPAFLQRWDNEIMRQCTAKKNLFLKVRYRQKDETTPDTLGVIRRIKKAWLGDRKYGMRQFHAILHMIAWRYRRLMNPSIHVRLYLAWLSCWVFLSILVWRRVKSSPVLSERMFTSLSLAYSISFNLRSDCESIK